jgi:hypothetical protein
MPSQKGTKKIGRPPELTQEIQSAICAAISLGAYLEAAAAFAGIGRETLRQWRLRGAKGEEPYRAFVGAIEAARAKKVLRYLQPIERACTRPTDPDWRAAAWVLERTEPEHYGSQERLAVEHSGERAILVLPARLTPEEYERQWLRDNPDKTH